MEKILVFYNKLCYNACMKRLLFILIGILAVQPVLFAAASREASGQRGNYLAESGRVIPPGDIHVDSYISRNHFNYPIPQTGAMNIITASGVRNNTAYLLMGLMGKKDDFSSLPLMNICFVIDISGSMASHNKLDWVKESFHVFIERVRPQDLVSVVIFDDKVEVLIKPTQVRNLQDRNEFKRLVDSLSPRGSTNIYGGMEMGYAQVEASFRQNYTNRVILLTDGMDNVSRRSRREFLDLSIGYKGKGINISTISLGAEADINLMVDVALEGGGSSRFITDRTIMEQTFGSELDRLIVTAAKNLTMELVLSDGVSLQQTWGYSNRISRNTVYYSMGTLHNGDYETIMAEVMLDRSFNPGETLVQRS